MALPRGVALVLIHALNPYGFAWVRRANEENVDLNRNFLLAGEPYAGSPARYAALDALLNPKHPPRRLDLFRLRAMASILRHGMPQLKQAVAGGQYDFPQRPVLRRGEAVADLPHPGRTSSPLGGRRCADPPRRFPHRPGPLGDLSIAR